MYNNQKYSLIVFLFFLIIFFAKTGFSQYWMHGAGSIVEDEAMSVSKDAAGNIYTTGYFGGYCEFSDTISFSTSGASDIFLMKQNSIGEVQWVVAAGGFGEDRGLSIKTDDAGNSYITGFFYGTADFGTQTLISSGGHDIFIAKYNTLGDIVWLIKAGGSEMDISNNLNLDNNGNVIITGQFIASAVFGSTTITSLINPQNSQYCINAFIAKYDNNGNFQWVKHGASDKNCRGIAVTSDSNGNIYATGEYSDTLSFDISHNNNIYNSIYLVKFDTNGNEQWFKKIGGSINNVAYSITTDNNNNILLTGEVYGILHFYDNSNYILSNTYDYQAFLAKFNQNGDLIWAVSDGSESEVSPKVVCTNDVGEIFISGVFKCKLSEYADFYGQGTFNSIGYDDIFVSKYDSNGQRLWSRNFGSKKEDKIHDMLISNDRPVIVGSFRNVLFMPIISLISNNHSLVPFPYQIHSVNYNMDYCSDSYYDIFSGLEAFGSSDIFIFDAINLNREPYDYYKRSGSICDRPYVGCCISDYSVSQYGDTTCLDTIEICEEAHLEACTNTSLNYYGQSVGPTFTYLWSTGAWTRYCYVSTSGTYSVTVTSEDGCFESSNSIEAIIHPLPAVPWISDNYGIGTNSPVPYGIDVCADSVVLTGSNITTQEYYWAGPGIGYCYDSVVTVYNDGLFGFHVVDSNGCSEYNYVHVTLSEPLPAIIPYFYDVTDLFYNDTIFICEGNPFTIHVFDSISDPTHQNSCAPLLSGTHIWSVDPQIPINYCGCYSCRKFYPDTSGYYHIYDTIIRQNVCDTDIVVVDKIFYVEIMPVPEIDINIFGASEFCPGDSLWLYACCDTEYHWYSNNGSFIGDPYNDSILVLLPGYYHVEGDTTNSYGCSFAYNLYHNVQYWDTPQINMLPTNGLICPNDSVRLSITSLGVNYEWFGPTGLIPNNSSTIYVNSTGYYFCIVTFPDSCRISSNTVEVKQYVTPFLIASPSETICQGDSVQICLVTNPGTNYTWNYPLSGTDLCQVVYDQGIYSCQATSCGITTNASISISVSNPIANITPQGPTAFCLGDSVVLLANSGMDVYDWVPGGLDDETITVHFSGDYYLITTDIMGCEAISDTIVINTLEVTAPIANDDTICVGQTTIITASGADNYNWVLSDTSTIPFETDSTWITPALYNSVTYYVYSADSLCHSVHVPVTIVVLDSLQSLTPQLFSNSPVCESDTLLISSNSPLGSIWHWSGPNGFFSADSVLVLTDLSSLFAGTYSLYIEYNGCLSYQSSIQVTIYPTPIVSISPDTLVCSGTEINLWATGGVSYTWSPSEWLDNASLSTPLASPDSSITFYVIVTDTNNCTNTESIHIQIQDIPNVTYGMDTVIIIGESTPLFIYSDQNNVEYIWSPDYEISCLTCPNPIASPLQTTEYYIEYTDSLGCVHIIVSVQVVVLDEFSLDVPMAFTPNGDGTNDIVYVRGWGIKELLEFRIYNRWGQEIFYTDDINQGWNGTYKEKLQNIDTYAYYVKVRFYNNAERDKSGTINLLR